MSVHKKIRDPRRRTRVRRKHAIRSRIHGTADKPRLSVFRSVNHIYAQAIDDSAHKVLAASSDLEKALADDLNGKSKKERARLVGKTLGGKLRNLDITKVVFDRNGFIYHGRIREVADGARESGLQF